MTKSELEAAKTGAWKNNDWQLAGRIQMVLNKMDGLLSAATTVRDRLTRLIGGLEQEGVLLDLNLPGHSFNTLGEVQAGGSEIDRLCGELGIAVDLLKELNRDRADASKPEYVPTPAELGEAAGRHQAATSRKRTAMGVQEARALGRQARKLERPVEAALTGNQKVDAHIRAGHEAASKEPKTYPVTDRRGRQIRVTIPND